MRQLGQLCDAIMGDDRAPSVLRTRANALFGAPLTFDPSGDGRRKGKALRALEMDEDFWAMCPETDLIQFKMAGDLAGVSFAELIWTEHPDHGGRVLSRLKVWHIGSFRYDRKIQAWFVTVENADGYGTREELVEPGRGKWVMYAPYGTARPWAHGLWRGMGALWLAKDFASRDFGRHQERHGSAIVVAISDPKQPPTDPQRAALVGYLGEIGRDTAIAPHAGFDLKLLEATARTWEMFTAQISLCNTGMSVMAIGTNLPTEVAAGIGTGAYAQNLVRLDYKRADAETMATTIHDQVLTWWAEWNFGNGNLAPWPHWDVEPPADRNAIATMFKTVCDGIAAALKVGVEPPFDALEEQFGWKFKVQPKAEMPPATPPANDDGEEQQEAA
jgi:phage gp29-like protein